MDESLAIKLAFETGAFWASEEGKNVGTDDLSKLNQYDSIVKDAFRARSIAQVTDYAAATFRHHARPPKFDGELGPALKETLSVPRCKIPDYYPPKGVSFNFEDPDLQDVVERMQQDGPAPAFGDGNWRGCHDVGNYHSATVRVDRRGLPEFLQPHFKQVLKNVQKAYAEIGLLFIFVDRATDKDMLTGEHWDGRINIEFSFVSRSSGWIGLAIVGQNQGCGHNIWCRFLSTYRPSDIVSEWTTLIKHELGHNCGMGHFPGRYNVMNPSIIQGLPTIWGPNDSSTVWLKRRFGGEKVPIDGGGGGGDKPPTGIEARVTSLEKEIITLQERADDNAVRDTVQDFSIKYLLKKLEEIG